jgi:hypothetical protein
MVKTQIQIPDYLYKEVKRISDQYEISLAEVVRRGLERVVPAYPERNKEIVWSLPELDLKLREDPFLQENWRERIYDSEENQ